MSTGSAGSEPCLVYGIIFLAFFYLFQVWISVATLLGRSGASRLLPRALQRFFPPSLPLLYVFAFVWMPHIHNTEPNRLPSDTNQIVHILQLLIECVMFNDFNHPIVRWHNKWLSFRKVTTEDQALPARCFPPPIRYLPTPIHRGREILAKKSIQVPRLRINRKNCNVNPCRQERHEIQI